MENWSTVSREDWTSAKSAACIALIRELNVYKNTQVQPDCWDYIGLDSRLPRLYPLRLIIFLQFISIESQIFPCSFLKVVLRAKWSHKKNFRFRLWASYKPIPVP